jgi:hypothetical protein
VSTPHARSFAGWGAAALAVLLVLALFWLLRPGVPAAVPLDLTAAKAQGSCVAAPDEIRRSHPDLLRHQRDLTVRGGVRGAQASLEACVNCHATPVAGAATPMRSVLGGSESFCQGCHTVAAVKLDCFQCHAAVPDGPGHGASGSVTAGLAGGNVSGLKRSEVSQ